MARFFSLPAICVVAIFLVPSTVLAAGAKPDRTQMNHDIRIQADENVADVTCLHCSIYVRGHVSGDVTAIAGSVVAETGASIAGDLTVIGGDARVESGAQVAGDLTTIGGALHRDPQATVNGDVTTMSGGGWLFLIFLLPLVFLGGIVALIIWLIQRSRRSTPVPAYTLHRN
jgi:hypothetical protein